MSQIPLKAVRWLSGRMKRALCVCDRERGIREKVNAKYTVSGVSYLNRKKSYLPNDINYNGSYG